MRSMHQVLLKEKRLQVASEGGTVEIRDPRDGRMKSSCRTALKRWMAIEMRWKKNWGFLSSPLTSEIRRPKSYREKWPTHW